MARRPKPTKILAGWRASTRLDEPEPEVVETLGEPPAWVGERARAHWDVMGKQFMVWGIFAKLDDMALALLAERMVDYIEARAAVEKEGTIAISEKGAPFQNPSVGIMNRAWTDISKMIREFGGTPASRASLGIAKKKTAANVVAARKRA